MIKKLLLLLLLVCGLWLLREAYYYLQLRQTLPKGAMLGEVEVSNMTPTEAGEALMATYAQPVAIVFEGERVEIAPADVSFALDVNGMLNQALQLQNAMPWWEGFVGHLLRRPLQPIHVPLVATHDEAQLMELVRLVGELLDDPPTPPYAEPETLRFVAGRGGYTADVTTTAEGLRQALYAPTNRTVPLSITQAEAPPVTLAMLQQVLENKLQDFDGYGSLFVMDLQTGEEIAINADIAVSGTSILKIAIMVEVYRALDQPPTPDQSKLLAETAIQSGNYSANLLLDVIAGQDNAYLGADIMTASLHRLGLVNSFMVTPYEEQERPEKVTLTTPANSGGVNTYPDRSMQTTAEDMGALLAMIYYCTQGGGPLLAVYPEQLTTEECQTILDLLQQNVEGNLIRFGVPETALVAHKHGWATNTHGDAGVIFSPGGAYVLVMYLTQPETDWLVADYSFPILRELSRITYNYFNQDAPYAGRPPEALIEPTTPTTPGRAINPPLDRLP